MDRALSMSASGDASDGMPPPPLRSSAEVDIPAVVGTASGREGNKKNGRVKQ